MDAKKQNYTTYKYKHYITLHNIAIWCQTDVAHEHTEFDHYCLHSYAFGQKTNYTTKDFNEIYL